MSRGVVDDDETREKKQHMRAYTNTFFSFLLHVHTCSKKVRREREKSRLGFDFCYCRHRRWFGEKSRAFLIVNERKGKKVIKIGAGGHDI